MKKELQKMSLKQLVALEKDIKESIYQILKEEIVEKQFHQIHFTEEGKYRCCHCNSTHKRKARINLQGKQRYYCNHCKKVMIAQQNVITFSSKKKFSQWIEFLKSMLDGDTLELSAQKVGISKRTAFRWRHKILYVMNNLLNQEVLFDVVYIDETLFPVIDKNPRSIKEERSVKRGMSEQKINVTCGIDIHGNTLLKVVDKGRVTSASLITVYDGNIKKGSKVVSDSLRSYHKLMKHLEIDWKKIPSKKKSIEEYNLEPINHLHALIKDFIYKYKGISIKYLQGYLAFFEGV